MSSRWWPNKIRQFARYMSGRVTVAERKGLGTWLTGRQLAVFDAMHRGDQRHGLDVVDALRRAGHTNHDLLVAGLLHDAGKGRDVRVWHRVAWSLSERYAAGEQGLLARLPGFRRAFAILALHAERSAALALAAGCTPLTAELIRHQADPNDTELGAALLLADEAS